MLGTFSIDKCNKPRVILQFVFASGFISHFTSQIEKNKFAKA